MNKECFRKVTIKDEKKGVVMVMEIKEENILRMFENKVVLNDEIIIVIDKAIYKRRKKSIYLPKEDKQKDLFEVKTESVGVGEESVSIGKSGDKKKEEKE